MRAITILFLLLVLSRGAAAQAAEQPLDCSPEGIAVGGYDLVSYHQDGGPVQGAEKYSAQLDGLTYLFASPANLARFREATAQFLPVYQGYCAASLAMGRLACPDYANFKIEDGRLLLFEVTGFTNGKTLWNSDPADFRQRADAHFPRLVP